MSEEQLAPKQVAESRVVLSTMMNPAHANALGNVHGGEIMKLADEAAGLVAMRHARSAAVTVAIDSMTFDEPIYVGNMVTLVAELTYTGRTSMDISVAVSAEDPLTGTLVHTNVAYFVFVAIDPQGRPHPVPPLAIETPQEQLRFQQAKERQEERVRRHQRELALREHQAEASDESA